MPLQGYFSDLTKSILVVSPWNFLQVEALFQGYGLQVLMGSRYLRGFVGKETAQALWLEEKVTGWWYLVATLAVLARRHPQTAYVGLQNSFQKEWGFVQRIIPGIGMVFRPVEDELRDTFLLALF